jgi:S1-C subfamily serine protease
MQRSILPIAVVVSAVVGAGAAVGVVEGLDLGPAKTSTTLVQQAPFGATSNANDATTGLTAGDIYKRDAPGVVFVRSQIVQRTQSPFDFGLPQEQQGEATGSGFVVDQAGTILTNAHVVNGATKVTVQFQNKESLEAKVLGKDESTDIALLQVDPAGLKLTPLTLGSSRGVQVGDPAIAIGNPFGLERTLTTGVISAVQRTIQAPNNFEIDDVLQTDAPINPGNSGGPLLDTDGRVIGINSQIETGGSGGGSVGIGFAVPIDTAKSEISQLEKGGTVRGAYLGLTSLTIDGSLSALNLPVKTGALVQTVQKGTAAEKAGIKGGTISTATESSQVAVGGDIIVSLNGKAVNSSEELANDVEAHKPGQTVKLGIMRANGHGGYDQKTLSVALGTRPNSIPNPNTPEG